MTSWIPDLASHAGPRYRAIADAIGEDIEGGRLPAGRRLPTQRELAERLGVTVGTVGRAYAEAARRGLLSGEVGRGTFVRRRPALALAERHEPQELIDLTRNHPPVPAGDAERRALETALLGLAGRSELAGLLAYPPDGGDPGHRAAGALWIARSGVRADPERVLVCSGSQHALTALLASRFRPGDRVLTEQLTYPGMKAAAELLHLRLEGLPLDRDGLQPEPFEAACARGGVKALYCVPTIHNPTSAVLPAERRRAIAEIARRHGVIVIEDDIHALLLEERPVPIAALAPERTYYLTTTSKTLAPGLRIAYVLAPPGEQQRLAAAIRATTWAAAPLTAEIASSWIRDGTADAILAARRREAAARQQLAGELLGGFGLRSHPCGYHAWLELPEPWRGEDFVAAARARGVGVTPAEAFAVGRGSAPHAVRVGLGGAVDRERLRHGLALLAETLRAPGTLRFPVV